MIESPNDEGARSGVPPVAVMQKADIQRAVEQLVSDPISVTHFQRVGGGCISEAFHVHLISSNGAESQWFLKSNDIKFRLHFQCEERGLAAIAETATITVPQVIAEGVSDSRAWLAMEWIDQNPKSGNFFATFGHQLAEMHRYTSGSAIGWTEDNYLGSTLQKNRSINCWPDFFAKQRIEFQLKMACDLLRVPRDLEEMVESILSKMHEILEGSEGETSLLHGDLWSGNYLSRNDGTPVLIDPAVYRGNREAEFGMLRLFGNCPSSFYDAYQETFPLPDGWQRRCQLYTLYHLLNHLNLFGPTYVDDCKRICHEILSA